MCLELISWPDPLDVKIKKKIKIKIKIERIEI